VNLWSANLLFVVFFVAGYRVPARRRFVFHLALGWDNDNDACRNSLVLGSACLLDVSTILQWHSSTM
jgi:hypothetical protein